MHSSVLQDFSSLMATHFDVLSKEAGLPFTAAGQSLYVVKMQQRHKTRAPWPITANSHRLLMLRHPKCCKACSSRSHGVRLVDSMPFGVDGSYTLGSSESVPCRPLCFLARRACSSLSGRYQGHSTVDTSASYSHIPWVGPQRTNSGILGIYEDLIRITITSEGPT